MGAQGSTQVVAAETTTTSNASSSSSSSADSPVRAVAVASAATPVREPCATPSKGPVAADGTPLRICCSCPETREPRDKCVVEKGEEHCRDLIAMHNDCLRKLGFKI